jgi:hypothetical protein
VAVNAMAKGGEAARAEKAGRGRLIAARALTVLAVLFALIGMLAFFVAHTVLEESGFRAISRQMIESDAIRTQVANTAVDSLYANVDVEAAIAARLPEAQKGLAPVLAGLSRSGADRAALTALERPRVQAAWVLSTTAAQRQLVHLLDDKSKFVETDGGKVVLDLHPIIIDIGDQVAVVGKLSQRLPPTAGRVVLIDESQLETAQTLTRILRSVANWMWLLALATAALAVWLARGRRRLELRALALGVLVVGLLMLVVHRAGGNYLVDHLAKDDTVKPAVKDAWNILSQTLVDRAWVWIILGTALLVGVWFVGDTGRALQARRASWPVLENRVLTYSLLAGLVIVLALIAPLFTRGWITSLAILVLAVVGVEVVRTIVDREQHPAVGS